MRCFGADLRDLVWFCWGSGARRQKKEKKKKNLDDLDDGGDSEEVRLVSLSLFIRDSVMLITN